MAEVIKLYDIEKRNYPDKRGDVFRSLQIFECWVCGSLSNRVIMGGYPGYGVRVVCPNSYKCWHHELEEKIVWLNKPHPQEYKDKLQEEIDQNKEQNKDNVENDLKGNPDMSLKRSVTNVRSYKPENPCPHWRY